MDLLTVLIGILAIVFGVYTGWARAARPDQFRKLESMKKFWGEKAGSAIHFVAYTVIPVLFGIAIVITGVRGRSLF